MATPDQPSSPPTLVQARAAAHRGDRRLAHAICVQIVTGDPRNEEAWVWRAGTAESPEETIFALSQALTLNPANASARHALYEAMQQLLQQDAFLAYVAETDDAYCVRTPTNFRFVHPKDRAVPEPYPPPRPPAMQAVFRWLAWSLVGLVPAGLGALVCAPAAMLAALRVLRQRPAQADRRRAWIALGTAVMVWLLALLLAALFVMHV